MKFLTILSYLSPIAIASLVQQNTSQVIPIIFINMFAFGICVSYLMFYQKSHKFKDDGLDQVNPPFLLFFAIMAFGILFGIHFIYKFHKRPFRTNMTEEEFEENLKSTEKIKNRDRKIRNLGL